MCFTHEDQRHSSAANSFISFGTSEDETMDSKLIHILTLLAVEDLGTAWLAPEEPIYL